MKTLNNQFVGRIYIHSHRWERGGGDKCRWRYITPDCPGLNRVVVGAGLDIERTGLGYRATELNEWRVFIDHGEPKILKEVIIK